jgi:hypothetical protein
MEGRRRKKRKSKRGRRRRNRLMDFDLIARTKRTVQRHRR